MKGIYTSNCLVSCRTLAFVAGLKHSCLISYVTEEHVQNFLKYFVGSESCKDET